MQYLGQLTYIALSELLYFLWQMWRLILASAAIVLLLFAVASIGILKRVR